LVHIGKLENQFLTAIIVYEHWAETKNYERNYMDQCITKQVLHVYSMDTCFILCFKNTTIYITYFQIQPTVMKSQVSGQCFHAVTACNS